MKHALFAALALLVAATGALAYKQGDLERLLRTRSCAGCDLRGANLPGARLGGADLRGADLGGANLSDADLRRANLQRANLKGANLSGADLRRANLQRANLKGADLAWANLAGADLTGTNLAEANLKGADLEGANLAGANLRGSTLEPPAAGPFPDTARAAPGTGGGGIADRLASKAPTADTRPTQQRTQTMTKAPTAVAPPPQRRTQAMIKAPTEAPAQTAPGVPAADADVLNTLVGQVPSEALTKAPSEAPAQTAPRVRAADTRPLQRQAQGLNRGSSEPAAKPLATIETPVPPQARMQAEAARRPPASPDTAAAAPRAAPAKKNGGGPPPGPGEAEDGERRLASVGRETRFAAVDRFLEGLVEAGLAFNVPGPMHVGDVEGIHVVLSPSADREELVAAIEEEGRREFHTIRVSDLMEAKLEGLGFDITPKEPQTQPVSGEQPTEWRWQVKAKDTGLQALYLTLSAVIVVNGTERRRKIDTFKKEILVEVTAPTWVQTILDFVTGFAGAITAIGGAVAVVYGGYHWLGRRRRAAGGG